MLLAGELKDGFTRRAILRMKRKYLANIKSVNTALADLESRNWIEGFKTEAGFQQKSTIRYLINPKIYEMEM